MSNIISKWWGIYVMSCAVGLFANNSLLAEDHHHDADPTNKEVVGARMPGNAARILPPSGKTISGPGQFRIRDGGEVSVLQYFGNLPEVSGLCITIFCERGTCNALSVAGEGEFMTVLAGETLTGCVGNTAKLDIKCQDGPCSGVWRADTIQ